MVPLGFTAADKALRRVISRTRAVAVVQSAGPSTAPDRYAVADVIASMTDEQWFLAVQGVRNKRAELAEYEERP